MIELAAFTCGKDPGAQDANEDCLVAVPGRVYAVVDGATDLGGGVYPGADGRPAKGGRIAAEAVGAALARIGRESPGLPEPGAVAAAANAAIAAVYARLGEAGPPEPAFRFRAAFAAAFEREGTLRLLALGDCGLRLDGRPVLAWSGMSDHVLATARARLWHLLVAGGADPAAASAAAFRVISQGLEAPPPAPVTAAHIADVRAHVAARDDLGPGPEREGFLAAGLLGVRADPGRFAQRGVDGASEAVGVEALDVPLAPGTVLEVHSDGYEAPPAGHTVAEWEAAQAAVDAEDPWRVGRFAGTKGPEPGRFFDDRTVLIVRWGGSAPARGA